MSKDIDIVIGRILNDFGEEVIKLMAKASQEGLDIIDEEQAKLLMNATIAIKQGIKKWVLELKEMK